MKSHTPIVAAEAEKFLDEFVDAFATFNGGVVAERYLEPFLAVDAGGSTTLLMTREDIGRYFQSFLDEYHASGSRSCRYRDLQITEIGSHSALLTVTWELVRQDATLAQSWRESYIVVRKESRLYVATSIDHAD